MSTLQRSSETGDTNTSPLSPLPAAWYFSQEICELERRAIFSQRWLPTTHKLRFPKTGDWLKYNIAGYAFILVKDREGEINAFHNVCRHRAFPVVTEEGGTSRIFSCQYHGWSYGLNGKLAKAPGYQDLEGFDKSKNGLLPIHVHVDTNGFIWLNLDAGEKPELSWEDASKEVAFQPHCDSFNWNDYDFDHAWEMTGEYNWKTIADHCNQYFHRPTAHFETSSPLVDLGSRVGDTTEDSVVPSNSSTPDRIVEELRVSSTFCLPNTSVTVSPHSFIMQRFVPTSPTTCSVRYEVYRNKTSNDEDFEMINQAYKRIAAKHNDVCIEYQKTLNTGGIVREPRPHMEDGLVDFQCTLRDLVTAHQKREEDAGAEIWPARQRLPQDAGVSQEDVDFCSKLTSNDSAAKNGCCGGGCGAGPPSQPATAPETMVW